MKKAVRNIRVFFQAHEIRKKWLILWALAAAVLLAVCCVLVCLSAGDGGRIFPVYMNEILASNTGYPNEDGRCCDYIELYNSADYPIDLTGFQLGDIAGSGRYAFSAGTIIDAQGYLVVYCDNTVDDAAYAGFGISRSGGESFYLIASNNAIVDSVVTLATDLDQSMVRLDAGQWGLSSVVTPGRANDAPGQGIQDIYNSGVSPVRITEFSAAGTGYAGEYSLQCDWVELHNTASADADIAGFTLSDNVGNDKYVFPEGTVIPAGGYLVVYCAEESQWEDIAPFGLSQLGGEAVVLKNNAGMIVEIVATAAMEGSEAMALGSGSAWALTQTPSPGFENTEQGHAAFLQAIGADAGTIVISELMADSQAFYPDLFGEFSDWVELYNAGEKTVDLAGWFLSDDPEMPKKWTFPALKIQPGEHLVIFCSGRGVVADGQVHTDFSLSSGGESLVLSSCLGLPVDSVAFGEGETNCSFVIDSASGQPALTNYPTPGYPNDAAGFEQFWDAAAPAGPLAIWEVMTSNDTYLPQALGECYDWVELRNISDSAVTLSDYSITDDPDIPGMYVLPEQVLAPGESVAVILSGSEALSTNSHAHAPFTLNAAEDQLLLYGAGGALVDFVYLKDIPLGQSYGRETDGGGFYYMDPTPERENTAGFRLISSEPTSSYAPGLYSGDTGFEVPLTAEGTIYYTTDGSEPDTDSARYDGPVRIGETAVLRAIAVEDGKMPSGIYTATFVVQEPHDLPVVSLVTDPDYLWGPNGVYRNGDMSVREIKFPANVAYLGDDGSFAIDCEMSLHGATTVTAFNKKTFTVRFRDNYDGPLNYDVFGDGEITTFSSLILRTSHESTYSTQMHDAFIGSIAAENCDTLISQKYKYAALYLNGEYWGLYAIREHHSPEHYASYMNVPASTVSMVRYCTDANNSLYELYNFCDNNNFRDPENYAYAKSVLDMTSFADWIIMEAYTGNIDINSNMRYYYSTTDGLWRCGLTDLDLGMTGGTAAFEEVANAFHHGRLVRYMLENEEFQNLLATRLAQLLAGPMSDENMIAKIDQMAEVIRSETAMEEERWGTPVSGWEGFVSDMKYFCDGRAAEVIDSLCYQVGFSPAEKDAYFGEVLQ